MRKEYETEINKMRKEVEKRECVGEILTKIIDSMEWDAMTFVEDDSEEGHHFEAPNEDDGWRYDRYVAYKEVIELIEKKYFK